MFDGGDPPAGLEPMCSSAATSAGTTILRWLDATGVRWVQLSGTGVDKVPAAVFDGRIVTCARGASAVPIAEWVLAAILARAKRFPEVFLHEPPKYWNFPQPAARLGRRAARSAIVGLGGIGDGHRASVRSRSACGCKAMRRTDAPSPIDGCRDRHAASTSSSPTPTTSCSPRRRPRARSTSSMPASFAVVKPGVHLVNIARGALVDQDALRVALDDGRVAARDARHRRSRAAAGGALALPASAACG